NQAYLVIILLARVVTQLGSVDVIDTGVIENLFSADLAFLQDLYRKINEMNPEEAQEEQPASVGE
ncbi:MAG TPA: hypothetical protein VMI31_14945, partial [Fimbriimonadaceae bacterium]|nr:hypothetical protein [Fimbriimonadaceae bacterium]